MRAPEESWMALILRPWRPMTLPMRLCEIRRRMEGVEELGVTGDDGLAATS